MPSAGRAKKQRRTALFKLSKVAATRKKRERKPPTIRSICRQHTRRAIGVHKIVPHSKRSRAQTTSLALKATDSGDTTTICTRWPNTGFPIHTYVHSKHRHTHKHTNRPPVVQSTSSRSPQFTISQTLSKMKMHFFVFVSVLKSGEPAPLTSLGGRQHPLADPLSKRCFETTLRNTSSTVLRIFTSLTGVIEGVTEARESY